LTAISVIVITAIPALINVANRQFMASASGWPTTHHHGGIGTAARPYSFGLSFGTIVISREVFDKPIPTFSEGVA
jgi:hypothetical protein